MPENTKQRDWAQCDRRIWETEIVRIAALQLVQELWVSLLKQGPAMTGCELAREIAMIEKTQACFDAGRSEEAVAEVSNLVNLWAQRVTARTLRQLRDSQRSSSSSCR